MRQIRRRRGESDCELQTCACKLAVMRVMGVAMCFGACLMSACVGNFGSPQSSWQPPVRGDAASRAAQRATSDFTCTDTRSSDTALRRLTTRQYRNSIDSLLVHYFG